MKKTARNNTEDVDSRLRDAGNDSASTAPRSTEESLSEDVFTESELSPIREELTSSEQPCRDKSSGASSESVKTVRLSGAECLTVISGSPSAPEPLQSSSGQSLNEVGAPLHQTAASNLAAGSKDGPAVDHLPETASSDEQTSTGIKDNIDQDFLWEDSLHPEEGETASVPCGEVTAESKQKQLSHKGKQGKEQNQDSETEVEELRKLWKTHTMQQTKQQRENMQQVSQKEIKHKVAFADTEGKENGKFIFYGLPFFFSDAKATLPLGLLEA